MATRNGELLATIDWTPVIVAIITLIGVIFSGCCTVYIAIQLRTPSGTRIGKQVEDAHHVGLANHYRIRALAAALGEEGEPDHLGEPMRKE